MALPRSKHKFTPPLSEEPKCQLAEIVQYTCDIERGPRGKPQVYCVPIPRFFRICSDRPAVEITRIVDVDTHTGVVTLPSRLSQALPKGKAWRDVVHYEDNIMVRHE